MIVGNGAKPVVMTPEGGLAYWVINKTGAASIKGTVVEPDASVDNAVTLISIDDVDPIGVVYDDGVPDGGMIRVVFSGRAEVFFIGSATRHHFARVCVAADPGAENGKVISETLPTPPLATDKHFREIGHVLESRTGAGLALVNLHFN